MSDMPFSPYPPNPVRRQRTRTSSQALENEPILDPSSTPRKRADTLRQTQERIRNFQQEGGRPRNFQEISLSSTDDSDEIARGESNSQEEDQTTQLQDRLERDRNFTLEGRRFRESAIVLPGNNLYADGQGRLPLGWDLAEDHEGRTMYVHRNSGTRAITHSGPFTLNSDQQLEESNTDTMRAVPIKEIYGSRDEGKGRARERTPSPDGWRYDLQRPVEGPDGHFYVRPRQPPSLPQPAGPRQMPERRVLGLSQAPFQSSINSCDDSRWSTAANMGSRRETFVSTSDRFVSQPQLFDGPLTSHPFLSHSNNPIPGPRKSSLNFGNKGSPRLTSKHEEQKRVQVRRQAEALANPRAGSSATAAVSDLQRRPAVYRPKPVEPLSYAAIHQAAREQPEGLGPANTINRPEPLARPSIRGQRKAPAPLRRHDQSRVTEPFPDFYANKPGFSTPVSSIIPEDVLDRGPNRSPIRMPPAWTNPSARPEGLDADELEAWYAKEAQKKLFRDQHWNEERKREQKRQQHWAYHAAEIERKRLEATRKPQEEGSKRGRGRGFSDTLKYVGRAIRRSFDTERGGEIKKKQDDLPQRMRALTNRPRDAPTAIVGHLHACLEALPPEKREVVIAKLDSATPEQFDAILASLPSSSRRRATEDKGTTRKWTFSRKRDGE